MTLTLEGHGKLGPLALLIEVGPSVMTPPLYVNATLPLYRQLTPKIVASAATLMVPPVFVAFQLTAHGVSGAGVPAAPEQL